MGSTKNEVCEFMVYHLVLLIFENFEIGTFKVIFRPLDQCHSKVKSIVLMSFISYRERVFTNNELTSMNTLPIINKD